MDTLKLKLTPSKLVFSVLLVTIGLAGCATNTPILDENYGKAVNEAKAQQTLNPDASLNTEPVAGIDGEAANAAIDRYHKSFVQPPVTTNIFNIGVGTNSGTGSGSSGTSR